MTLADHLILVGVKHRSEENAEIVALRVQTSGVTEEPHRISLKMSCLRAKNRGKAVLARTRAVREVQAPCCGSQPLLQFRSSSSSDYQSARKVCFNPAGYQVCTSMTSKYLQPMLKITQGSSQQSE